MTRRAPRRRRDEGVTLVELVVAMGLTSILLAAVATVFVGVTRGVHDTDVRTGTDADGRIASEAITRTLRAAVVPPGQDSALADATTSSITLYSSLQRGPVTTVTASPTGAAAPRVSVTLPPPTQVTYRWDAPSTCLQQVSVVGTANTGSDAVSRPWVWTAAPTTSCLARTTTPPAFAYFTSSQLTSGAPASDAAALPVPAGASLVQADRQRVVSIGVTVTVTDPGDPTIHPAVLVSRTVLQNVAIGAS